MSFRAKKPVFFGILSVFIIFSLPTCVESPENIGEITYTDVEYSEDGKTITIYLDGSAPVRADRALSQRLARLGHDFFEVTFLYNTDGTAANYKIAKASWELGEPAGITDVYRTETGIDYYPPPPTIGIPDTGRGSVILFIGRKSDKTLLAVGTLKEIDGVSVTNAPKPLIRTTTRKISFDVNALKAGVAMNPDNSSFKTPTITQGNPLEEIKIGGEFFPFFNLPKGQTNLQATYTIDVHSPATHPYSFYAPSIIYAHTATVGGYTSEGAKCSNIVPKYTLPLPYPDNIQKNSRYEHSSDITFNITSPTAVGAFSGTIGFSINTGLEGDVICALTFEVPVYAVYNTAESILWYIKPGYNEFSHELDKGTQETGGAVLIGIDIVGVVNRGIVIKGKARKYSPYEGMTFDLSGIQILFRDGDLENITPAPYYYSDYPDLVFYYDDDFDSGTPPVLIPSGGFTFGPLFLRKKVTIWVRYYPDPANQSVFFENKFVISIYNINRSVNIPYQNRFVIAKANDFTQIQNRVNYLHGQPALAPEYGNFLFVFSENINIAQMTFDVKNRDIIIFMVATVPNLIIGRDGASGITFTDSYNATVFIGDWPFNEPAFAGGDVLNDEFFKINAGGTWQDFNNPPIQPTNFFRTSSYTGTLTIDVLADMEENIWHPSRLGP